MTDWRLGFKTPGTLKNIDVINTLGKLGMLFLDFDGTLTDGFVYVSQTGEETVRCSRRDGAGISMLKKSGILVTVISSEENPVVAQRCKKLSIPCFYGIENKVEIAESLARKMGWSLDQCAFMGDDINDLELMKLCGFKITVANGCSELKEICDYITVARGGDHAVREICDMLLSVRQTREQR